MQRLIYCLSQNFIYASKIFNPVINGFSPNYESSHLHSCDHSIVTFGIKKLGLSNTSHVDILDRFRRTVVDRVKIDILL